MSDDWNIRPLATAEDRSACIALQKDVWGQQFSELVPSALLYVVQRIGGVAAGAFDANGQMLGFVFGMTGLEGGRPVHWSDMLAVRSGLRNQGLGIALKRYQRETVLSYGVHTMYWTFDPLESRNAYVNLTRLGATSAEYHRDLYGPGDSPLHRGIGTDRLLAEWDLPSERVRQRLASHPRTSMSDITAVPLVNATTEGAAGPMSADPDLSLEAPAVRIRIPDDIQALKEAAPDAAVDWRGKTRAAFETYFRRGYRAVEVARETGGVSSYVLTVVRQPLQS